MGDDGWLAGSGDIRYEVGSLADFAERMRERLAEFQSSLNDGVLPMGMAAMPGSQLAESELFARAHRTMVEASHGLIEDINMGLRALELGAQTVENQYQTGDALSAATNDAVLETFNPLGTEYPTLQGLAEQQAAQNGQNGQGTGGPSPTAADHAAAAEHGNPQAGPSGDGSSIHDGQQILPGEPGHWEVPADNEGMRDAPTGPERPD